MNIIIDNISIILFALMVLGILAHLCKAVIFYGQIKTIDAGLSQFLSKFNQDAPDEEEFLIYTNEIRRLALKIIQIFIALTLITFMTYFGWVNLINELSHQYIYTRIQSSLGSALYETTIINLFILIFISFTHIVQFPLAKVEETQAPNTGIIKNYFIKITASSIVIQLILTPIFLISYQISNFWIWILSSIIGFKLITEWLIPEFIKPLINKKYLPEPELSVRIAELFNKVGSTLIKVYITEASQEIKPENPIRITGGEKSKIVLISNYIIDKLNPDEIVCLVAAELAQVQYKHRLLSLITSSLIWIIFFFLGTEIINKPYIYQMLNFHIITDTPKTGLYICAFFLILLIFIPFIECIKNYFIRMQVFKIDSYVAQYCDPRLIFETSKKLSTDKTQYLPSLASYSKLFRQTPSIEERKLALNLQSNDIIL